MNRRRFKIKYICYNNNCKILKEHPYLAINHFRMMSNKIIVMRCLTHLCSQRYPRSFLLLEHRKRTIFFKNYIKWFFLESNNLIFLLKPFWILKILWINNFRSNTPPWPNSWVPNISNLILSKGNHEHNPWSKSCSTTYYNQRNSSKVFVCHLRSR